MPTAFRNGSLPLPVLTPDLVGACVWCDDGSEISTGLDTDGNARVTGWSNRVFPVNGHLFADLFGVGNGPYAGLDSLDGHPSLTWRVDVDNTQRLEIDTLIGSHVAVPMKDTLGADFRSTSLIQTPRTLLAVITPRFDAGTLGGMIGGTVASWSDSTPYLPLFEQSDDLSADQFAGFASQLDWGRGTAHYLAGPNTPGGAGSIYDGTPILAHYETAGGTDIAFRVNGVVKALTPGVIDLAETAAGLDWTLGDRSQPGSGNKIFRFKGTLNAILVLDYKLSTNPAALTRDYTYFLTRYPTLGATAVPFVVP